MAVVALPHAAASAGVARRRLVADLRRRGVCRPSGSPTPSWSSPRWSATPSGTPARCPGTSCGPDWDVRDGCRRRSGSTTAAPTPAHGAAADRSRPAGRRHHRGRAGARPRHRGGGRERLGRGTRGSRPADLGDDRPRRPARPARDGARLRPGSPSRPDAHYSRAGDRRPFDVVVIGGGPAGASAALAAARRGARTVLLERAELPRYKTCGGGLVGLARDQLAEHRHRPAGG